MSDDTEMTERISQLQDRISELEVRVKRLQSYIWSIGGYAIVGAVGVVFLWAGS